MILTCSRLRLREILICQTVNIPPYQDCDNSSTCVQSTIPFSKPLAGQSKHLEGKYLQHTITMANTLLSINTDRNHFSNTEETFTSLIKLHILRTRFPNISNSSINQLKTVATTGREATHTRNRKPYDIK